MSLCLATIGDQCLKLFKFLAWIPFYAFFMDVLSNGVEAQKVRVIEESDAER